MKADDNQTLSSSFEIILSLAAGFFGFLLILHRFFENIFFLIRRSAVTTKKKSVLAEYGLSLVKTIFYLNQSNQIQFLGRK